MPKKVKRGSRRGRRPKPTALKRATGNPGKRKLNEHEPKPDAAVPEFPPHLDAEAQEEWARVTPQLMRLRVLTRLDRAALAVYCQAWSRWVDAETKLRQFGAVIKTPRGYPVQNPYLGIANTAMATMLRYLGEFGMTPSSRSRIMADEGGASAGGPTGETKDEWAQFEAPGKLSIQ